MKEVKLDGSYRVEKAVRDSRSWIVSWLVAGVVATIGLAFSSASAQGISIVPDSSFSSGGVLMDDSRDPMVPRIAMSANEELLVTSGSLEVRKVTSAEQFDVSYGEDGYSPFIGPLLVGDAAVGDLDAAKGGGSLLAASTYTRFDGFSSAGSEVLSLLRSGRENPRFGKGGFFGEMPGGAPSTTATAVAQRSDGRIYVAGGVGTEAGRNGIGRLLLLGRDGNRDPNFGQRGAFRRAPSKPARSSLVEFTDVLTTGRGKALVAGLLGEQIAVYKVDRHGRPVRSFGRAGSLTAGFHGYTGIDSTSGSAALPKVDMKRDRARNRSYILFRDDGESKILAFGTRTGKRASGFGHRGIKAVAFTSGSGTFIPMTLQVLDRGELLLAGGIADGNIPGQSGAFLVLRRDGTAIDNSLTVAPSGVGKFTDFAMIGSDIYAAGYGERSDPTADSPLPLAVSKYSLQR